MKKILVLLIFGFILILSQPKSISSQTCINDSDCGVMESELRCSFIDNEITNITYTPFCNNNTCMERSSVKTFKVCGTNEICSNAQCILNQTSESSECNIDSDCGNTTTKLRCSLIDNEISKIIFTPFCSSGNCMERSSTEIYKTCKDNEICSDAICVNRNNEKEDDGDVINKTNISKYGNLTKEQFKEFVKEKTEERKIFKFEEKTGQECVDGCKCNGVVMKCELEDGTREMTVYTKSGNIIFQVKNVNASTQVTLYHNNKTTYAELQNGIVKEIKIMPDEVQEKIKDKIKSKLEKFNITLDENGVYEIQMQKKSRLFFLFLVREKVQAQVNSENGEVVKIRNPWWGFLAKDVKENANETEE